MVHEDFSPHCSSATSDIVSSQSKVAFHKNHLPLLFWAGMTGLLFPSSLQILFLPLKGHRTGQAILTPYWKMFIFCKQSSVQHHTSLKQAAVAMRCLLVRQGQKPVLHNRKTSCLLAFHTASRNTCGKVYILRFSITSQRSGSKTLVAYLARDIPCSHSSVH